MGPNIYKCVKRSTIYKNYATDEMSAFWTNVMERHQFMKKNEVSFCNIDNQ